MSGNSRMGKVMEEEKMFMLVEEYKTESLKLENSKRNGSGNQQLLIPTTTRTNEMSVLSNNHLLFTNKDFGFNNKSIIIEYNTILINIRLLFNNMN